MPLDNFDKTFWVDPQTGNTHFFNRLSSSRSFGSPPGSRKNGYAESIISKDQKIPSYYKGYQGLLVHPLSGTGLKDDPLNDPGERASSIRKLTNTTTPEDYGSNTQLANYGNVSGNEIKSGRTAIFKGLDTSFIPTHQLDVIPTTPTAVRYGNLNAAYRRDKSGWYSTSKTGEKYISVNGATGDNSLQKTLLHELGHAASTPDINEYKHRDRTDNPGADPANEGYAEGFQARNVATSPIIDGTRPLSHATGKARYYDPGYSMTNWAKDLHQAVFVAAKAHAYHNGSLFNLDPSEGQLDPSGTKKVDEFYGDIPFRKTIYDKEVAKRTAAGETEGVSSKAIEHTHLMTLGFLYHKHAPVREAVDYAGHGDLGRSAADYYRKSVTDAGSDGSAPTLF